MAAANFLWLRFAETIEAQSNLFFDISGSWFSHDVMAAILLSRPNPLERDYLRKHILIREVSNQMTAEKRIPKKLLRPITTGENSAMNQLEFLTILPVISSGKASACKG